MIQNLKELVYKGAIIAMASFVFLTSCEEPNQGLGFSQIIGNNVKADSMAVPIITYTKEIDSVLVALSHSDQLILGGYRGSKLAGHYSSPLFGEASAATVTEILPTNLNLDFGSNPKVDSVLLYLRVTDAYGDTTQPVSFKVSQLGNKLSKDSLFYSSFSPAKSVELGTLNNILIKPNSQSRRDGFELPSAIKIPLDTNFFQEQFADIANGSASEFSSFENFLDYYKGMVIEATKGECITYFNLNSTLSSLQIFFHNDNDTALTASFDFLQNKSTVPIHFNIFDQDFSSATINLANQDTVQGEERTFTQSMGGLATIIKISNARFDSLIATGAVINKAELTLHTDVLAADPLSPNRRLELRKMTARGPGDRILDFAQNNGGGGDLQAGRFRNNRYRFDLTRHLFEVTDKGKNPNLAVVPTAKTTVANRTVLRGGRDPLVRTRLIIYYTNP